MPLARRSLDRLSRQARRVTSGWRRGPDDEQFLDETFRSLLGRPVDPAGRAHFLKVLAARASRHEIVEALQPSDEDGDAQPSRDLAASLATRRVRGVLADRSEKLEGRARSTSSRRDMVTA